MKKTASTLSAASIGFHIIVEAKRVNDFLQSQEDTEVTHLIQSKIDFLNSNPDIASGWRGSGNESGGTTKSLLEIFNDFRARVDKIYEDQISYCNRHPENPAVRIYFLY